MTANSPLLRRLSVAAVVPILTVVALGCGSSSKPSSGSASNGDTTTTQLKAAASTSSDVSGSWKGTYSGSFSGTFTVNWQQSGSKLTGTIDVSELGGQIPINGTLDGNSISFGTVGSTAITYTGSVSSNSMSGDWKLSANGQASGNGTWKASKA